MKRNDRRISLLFIGSFIFLLILLFLYRTIGSTFHEVTHEFSTGDKLFIEAEKKLSKKERATKSYASTVEDVITSYQVGRKGNLTIVERRLPNDDQFIFLKWQEKEVFEDERYQGEKEFQDKLTFKLAIQDSNKYEVKSFSAKDVERPHDNTVGIDEATYPN